MYTPIENMPDSSRVWIFQANRELNNQDQKVIAQALEIFCSQWAAHGHDLKTSFGISHNRFVLLAVDEGAGAPSGCSIDSSTHVIKKLEEDLAIDFFNRAEIAFVKDGEIKIYPLTDLKKMFADGRLNENSIALNTLVATLGDWRKKSTLSVKDGWLKRYIPKTQLA